MPLSPKDRLGPYEILDRIGKGGMGEVYRARDARLNRDVAIKVSTREFATKESKDRFEREAHAIAALNHPNICTLFDVGSSPDGSGYLVMELVEGESLSTLLGRGALPVEQALRYAIQIVDALAEAHSKGIVHRDLKPGNIIIAKNGAKVLDFGLAKLTADLKKDSTPSDITLTITEPITRTGTILGTLSYMAPEQAEGKETDARSDIFSFGVVLYEMLAGRRPFNGDTQAAVLASILKDQPPPLNTHQPTSPQSFDRMIPRSFERLVRKCLEKKPDDRWQSARDLKPALELIDLDAPPPVAATSTHAAPPPPAPRKRWLWPAIATGLVVIFGAGFGGYRYYQANSFTDLPLLRQDVNLGPDIELMPPVPFATNFAISPDGARIVYIARPTAGGPPRLYTRRLDRANAIELPGTENPRNPFFSPDGEWIGFVVDRKLYKISVDGGALVPLMDLAGQFEGASWVPNMIVVAQGGSPLVRISDTGGGQPTTLAPFAEGEILQSSPQILPGGEAVLFATNLGNKTGLPDPNQSRVEAMSLKDHKRTIVQNNTNSARYVHSRGGLGHLLYTFQGGLYAVPFNASTLEKQGPAVPVLNDMQANANINGKYSVSDSGTLIYQKGLQQSPAGALRTLQWIDAAGKVDPIPAEPADLDAARVSPDGSRLAVEVIEGGRHNIRVLDWRSGRTTSLTFGDGDYGYPLWTPDGQQVVFARSSGNIYFAPADGSGQRQQLTQAGDANHVMMPWSFSPDGTQLAFLQQGAGPTQIWMLPIHKEGGQLRAGTAEKFTITQSFEDSPNFSPDGKWLAYWSRSSNGLQIHVRPTSGQAGLWMITTAQAAAGMPMWSHSSSDLLFRQSPDSPMMAAHYTAQGDTFVADKPRLWMANTNGLIADLSPDGKRLLAIVSQRAAAATPVAHEIVFLQNFFDELRRRAPAGK